MTNLLSDLPSEYQQAASEIVHSQVHNSSLFFSF